MDSSSITRLLQKQNTRYINRAQTVDSSTLTWKNQIQSSKYIKGVQTCNGEKNTNVPTQSVCSNGDGTCNYGGQGKQVSIMTGSPQKYPSVYSGASGSAAQVYSSDVILLQKAGNNSCGVPGLSPAPENSYVVLPPCYCVNTNAIPPPCNKFTDITCIDGPNGPVSLIGLQSDLPINNQSNPYLPPFDTYYRFKNPIAQCTAPIPDQNQKHFVKQCHTRFPNANNGVNVLCTDCSSPPYLVNGQLIAPSANAGKTCDKCILEP
jgi:hypothetical protein